jgi:hypothetical protein
MDGCLTPLQPPALDSEYLRSRDAHVTRHLLHVTRHVLSTCDPTNEWSPPRNPGNRPSTCARGPTLAPTDVTSGAALDNTPDTAPGRSGSWLSSTSPSTGDLRSALVNHTALAQGFTGVTPSPSMACDNMRSPRPRTTAGTDTASGRLRALKHTLTMNFSQQQLTVPKRISNGSKGS